jgi:hypothetical protein
MFLNAIDRPVFIKAQRFGGGILSPASGKTYSVRRQGLVLLIRPK